MRSIHPGTAASVVGIVPSEPAKSMPRNTRPDPPPRIWGAACLFLALSKILD